jgi:hypothetical protein
MNKNDYYTAFNFSSCKDTGDHAYSYKDLDIAIVTGL